MLTSLDDLALLMITDYEGVLNTHYYRCSQGFYRRTPERVAPLPVFETGAFNLSATLPLYNCSYIEHAEYITLCERV